MKHFKALKAVLFALALVAFTGVAFGTVKAQAADDDDPVDAVITNTFNWKYDSTKDQIEIRTTSNGAIKYKAVVIGTDEEVEKKFSKVNFTTKESTSSTPAVIKLDDKSKGIKFAENRDAYLWVSDIISTSKKAIYKANVTVKASSIKKIAVTINYAKVTSGNTAAASDFIKVQKLGEDDDEFVDANVTEFVYSTDAGKTWCELSTVTAGSIYVDCTKTKATTMLIRMKGTDDATGAGTGVRPSKTIKVKLALVKAAPKVKVDVKKSTIVIKNGYDYAAAASGTAIGSLVWNTVLPYNKNSDNAVATAASATFVPYAKIDEEETGSLTAFTNKKVDGFAAADILVSGGYTDIYVRKSATTKAPATKSVKITVAPIAAAPQIEKLDATGASIKISVTNSAIKKYEYVIVHAADYDTVDWTKISFKKFDGKTKFYAAKTKTTSFTNLLGEKIAADEIADGDVIVIRVQGDAKKNLLPSASKAYTFALDTYTKNDEEVLYFDGFTAK